MSDDKLATERTTIKTKCRKDGDTDKSMADITSRAPIVSLISKFLRFLTQCHR